MRTITIQYEDSFSNQQILRECISVLKPHQYFMWPNSNEPHIAARKLGKKIVASRTKTGWRIWRIFT